MKKEYKEHDLRKLLTEEDLIEDPVMLSIIPLLDNPNALN